jgi:hypothetical protein
MGTHVHGAAEMTLVFENQQLYITFTIPAVDLLGVERAPANEQEQQRLEQLLENLRVAENQLSIPPAAECRLVNVDVNSALLAESNNSHADFTLDYRYTCTQPKHLTRLELPLFARYPSLTNLNVSWIVNDRQGASKLTRNKSELHF